MRTGDPIVFKSRLMEWVNKKAPKAAERHIKNMVYTIYSNCIELSPVDTGRFRLNWMVYLGRISRRVVQEPQKDSAPRFGSPPTVNEIVSSRVEANLRRFKLGDRVYISNAVPYAERLEYEGWSKQAPAGILRVALIQASIEFNARLEAAPRGFFGEGYED